MLSRGEEGSGGGAPLFVNTSLPLHNIQLPDAHPPLPSPLRPPLHSPHIFSLYTSLYTTLYSPLTSLHSPHALPNHAHHPSYRPLLNSPLTSLYSSIHIITPHSSSLPLLILACSHYHSSQLHVGQASFFPCKQTLHTLDLYSWKIKVFHLITIK